MKNFTHTILFFGVLGLVTSSTFAQTMGLQLHEGFHGTKQGVEAAGEATAGSDVLTQIAQQSENPYGDPSVYTPERFQRLMWKMCQPNEECQTGEEKRAKRCNVMKAELLPQLEKARAKVKGKDKEMLAEIRELLKKFQESLKASGKPSDQISDATQELERELAKVNSSDNSSGKKAAEILKRIKQFLPKKSSDPRLQAMSEHLEKLDAAIEAISIITRISKLNSNSSPDEFTGILASALDLMKIVKPLPGIGPMLQFYAEALRSMGAQLKMIHTTQQITNDCKLAYCQDAPPPHMAPECQYVSVH